MRKYDSTLKQPFYDKCRLVAAEGCVLLKNDKKTLPLTDHKISVFGRVQIDYYRSGTGSGGAVNVARKTNLLDSLRGNDHVQVNETLAAVYEAWVKDHPFDNGGGGWASEPWFQEEMPVTMDLVRQAGEVSDKAVVVIGRTAGEDVDNVNAPGGYLLTDKEKDLLRKVTAVFSETVLVFNTANIMDMTFLKEEGLEERVTAILYAWQGGQEGGLALADVLAGDANPSGHLTDTIAEKITDYPSDANFGTEDKSFYAEDIYVGYRYFETFAPDKVLYPFGFGLSYTSFELSDIHAEVRGSMFSQLADTVVVHVTVTNTGDCMGKEVVQVYYQAPQGQLGQPLRQLVAFQKTDLLSPCESQEIELLFPVSRMASYDDSGVSGYPNAWVLEQGRFRFYVGTDVRSAREVQPDGQDGYPVFSTLLVRQTEEACAPEQAFRRLKPLWEDDAAAADETESGEGSGTGETKDSYDQDPEMLKWIQRQKKVEGIARKTYEEVPLRKMDLADRIQKELPPEIPMTGDLGWKLRDVKEGKCSLETFLGQLSLVDLTIMVRGEGMCSPKVTPGTAGAFGGVSDSLLEKGIPTACCSDGPSGIRQDNGEQATQMPIGTLLACTWNPELVTRLYELEGQELAEKEIDSLLGPGINIHRHPLNGRNFEYFSEDPMITAYFAAACVAGIQQGGSDATVKHFACNNQELARRTGDFILSQRALREIYLKAFEFVVREAGVHSIMTSYNEVNGYHSASNYELVTTILRKEWGYTGIVMTDWFTFMNPVLGGPEQTVKDTASMVRSQNDLYMVVHNNGAEANDNDDNLEEAVKNGTLTIAELQRAAANICRFLLGTASIDREIRPGMIINEFQPAQEPAAVNLVTCGENGSFCLELAENASNLVEIKEDGLYDVHAVGSFKALPTAQSAATVTVNGEAAPMITMSGDPYRPEMRQKFARFRLSKGFYQIDVKVTKGGMKLYQLLLVKAQGV